MKRSAARRIGLPLMGVLFLGILGVVASYQYWAFLRYHFSTVTEGQVYRSGAMPPEMLKTIVQRYGIRAVVDLRDPGEEVDAECAALARLGVKHFHVPSDQVPKDQTVRAFLEIMDHREYRPVLIHCKHGEGRAVLFAAIYRMEYEGWPNERARRASRLLPWFGSFSSKRRKGIFILNYVRRRRRRASEAKPSHLLRHEASLLPADGISTGFPGKGDARTKSGSCYHSSLFTLERQVNTKTHPAKRISASSIPWNLTNADT